MSYATLKEKAEALSPRSVERMKATQERADKTPENSWPRAQLRITHWYASPDESPALPRDERAEYFPDVVWTNTCCGAAELTLGTIHEEVEILQQKIAHVLLRKVPAGRMVLYYGTNEKVKNLLLGIGFKEVENLRFHNSNSGNTVYVLSYYMETPPDHQHFDSGIGGGLLGDDNDD